MKGITVHPFRVEPDSKKAAPLAKILDAIAATPIDKRMRLCSHAQVRVEEIKKGPDGLYLLDFTKLRFENAPGRATSKTATKDIDFQPGEGAAEETAALYDPVLNHLIIQYNHHGVRAGKIAEYFSNFDDVSENLYHLEPRFEKDIERRLAQKSIIKAIRFRVSTDAVSAVDKASGQSIAGILAPARDLGAEYIEIMLNAERLRERGLKQAGFRQIMSWLAKRMNADPDSVTSLKVTGKVDADSKAEVLDLLGNKLSQSFNDLKIGSGLRYPRAARWSALVRARSGWLKELK